MQGRRLFRDPIDALPRADEIVVDGRVLAFATFLCLFAALVFGVAPASNAHE